MLKALGVTLRRKAAVSDQKLQADLNHAEARSHVPGKSMRDAWASFSPGLPRTGDISLATYLMQHVLQGPAKGIASIGRGSDQEFFLLNALTDAGSSLVYLNIEQSADARRHLSGMTNHVEVEGFPQRTVVSDLMLPSRWPGLLKALAVSDTRMIGIDAAWAPQDPQFWENLSGFLSDSAGVAFLRGVLDYSMPQIAISLLQSKPGALPVEVIASTPGALWFASADAAPALRAALAGSGLFELASPATDASTTLPVIVRDDAAMGLMDETGRLPLALLKTNSGHSDAIQFLSGWSSAEADGCWTEGEEARILIKLPASERPVASLIIEGNPWLPPSGVKQVIEFGLGPVPADTLSVEFAVETIQSIAMPISGPSLLGNTVEVVLRVHTSGRPADFGGVDTRALGYKLRSIGLFERRASV